MFCFYCGGELAKLDPLDWFACRAGHRYDATFVAVLVKMSMDQAEDGGRSIITADDMDTALTGFPEIIMEGHGTVG